MVDDISGRYLRHASQTDTRSMISLAWKRLTGLDYSSLSQVYRDRGMYATFLLSVSETALAGNESGEEFYRSRRARENVERREAT